jgi:hypothetical protein
MEELLAITGMFTFPLTIVFGVAWWNARKELQLRRDIARELGVQPLPPRALNVRPATAPELQRLEDSIEAIALEVERLADGQRFVAKLLGERPITDYRHERPGASAALPPVTPH